MSHPSSKIRSLPEAMELCQRLRAQGKRIVFTNGCFDLLHPGHTRYLAEAKALGDFLVVGLNSDRSVRSIKGPERPVMPEQSRAEVLAALASVDCVVLFDEPDPLPLIQSLLPHVLVKGGDWPEEAIVGGDVVRKAGGEVRRIPYFEGFSTSRMLQRIRNLRGEP